MIIDLINHMDAGDRMKWTSDQDLRPLSELGREQADRYADALEAEPIEALYSSPALRCVQTIEPLARRRGLSIETFEGLRDTDGWRGPSGWEPSQPTGAAYAAGRASRAVELVRQRSWTHVAMCTHGDVLPALVAFYCGRLQLSVDEPLSRAHWYRLRFDDSGVSAERRTVLSFPPDQ